MTLPRNLKPPTHKHPLALAIRRRRFALNLKQDDLAETCGIHPNTIIRAEQLRSGGPSLLNFEAIVNSLGGTLEIKWKPPRP